MHAYGAPFVQKLLSLSPFINDELRMYMWRVYIYAGAAFINAEVAFINVEAAFINVEAAFMLTLFINAKAAFINVEATFINAEVAYINVEAAFIDVFAGVIFYCVYKINVEAALFYKCWRLRLYSIGDLFRDVISCDVTLARLAF